MQHFTKNCRKIVCVGRNFAEHAKELNNPIRTPRHRCICPSPSSVDLSHSPPTHTHRPLRTATSVMVFLKPPSSFLAPGEGSIEVPPGCSNLHHEGSSLFFLSSVLLFKTNPFSNTFLTLFRALTVELGVVIAGSGRDIPRADVSKYIKGYFVGLDMTAREIQSVAKANGHPWSVAKGMDTFAPVSELIPADKVTTQGNVELWLKVNGVEKQRGNTKDMIFDIPALISYISTVFKLEDGDCIFTGTPAGVGAVKSGDVITAGVINKDNDEELATIKFNVVDRVPAAKL